jgi:TonB-linked SusC/RagA family outer membrane protein
VAQLTFAQERIVSGIVSDNAGIPIPGVSVLIKGSKTGVQTDFDGSYSIKATPTSILVFSYVGLITKEMTASSTKVNVKLSSNTMQLENVVVTTVGIKKSARELSFATQQLKGADLQKARSVNVSSAIAGKIAGVQVLTQAGSKLGSAGSIRIRGNIGLTDKSAMYVVNGIQGIDPNSINMDDVETLDVLKGPSATALYGQRADAGVILITTKTGKGKGAMSASYNTSIEVDDVQIVAKYQNKYGGGSSSQFSTFIFNPANHPAEWQVLDGKRYHDFEDDSSWGPKYDGGEYIPWQAFYRGTEYSNKTVKYEAQPDNIKNFYDQAVTLVNGISVNQSGDSYNAAINYTNRDQKGILPGTSLKSNQFSLDLTLKLTNKFTTRTNYNYTNRERLGEFSDGYRGSGSGGSFNQWFQRDVDTRILRNLDYVRADGKTATWNIHNPLKTSTESEIALGNYWANPYSNYSTRAIKENYENTFGFVDLNYKFTDHINATGTFSRNEKTFYKSDKMPVSVQNSANQTGIKNFFGNENNRELENNLTFLVNYDQKFGYFGIKANIAGNIRDNYYYSFAGATRDGLIIPDFYALSNSKTTVPASVYNEQKQVRSIYGSLSLDYKNMLYLNGTLRRDYSSALNPTNNGFTYPSLGGSFIFSELTKDFFPALNYGKLRAGFGQVGSDLKPYELNPKYGASTPYSSSNPNLNYTGVAVDANIIVPINTSIEYGVDLKFLNNRIRVDYTYFDETRENEIQYVSVSSGSGSGSLLTNAGSFSRKGHELTIGLTPIKTENFTWTMENNWATVKSMVLAINDQVDEISTSYGGYVSFTHTEGKEWGQLKGNAYQLINGQRVLNTDGTYATTKNQYFGSILPKYNGGMSNVFTYKNFSLAATVDYQKGGQSYSLSRMFGTSSGITERTAGVNPLGNEERAPLDLDSNGKPTSTSGGVFITGVNPDGTAVTKYMEGQIYYQQFNNNLVTEENIIDLSYIKLREISFSCNAGKKTLNQLKIFTDASFTLYARNLAILYKDKKNDIVDPSMISNSTSVSNPTAYFEGMQLPGTKTYGFSLKLNF